MLTGHVPAVRFPPDHATSHVAAAVPARGGVEDRRNLNPAPPARVPAAAAAAPPEAELGGPGPARGAARRDTERSPPRIAPAGHPGHDLALAPRYRPALLGCQVHAGQDRPAICRNVKAQVLRSHARTPNGATAGSTASWPGWESRSRRRPYGRSSRPTASTPRRGGPGQPGRSSCVLRPRPSWHATSSRSTCSTAPRLTCWP
jgi:hypothetical protein